MYASYTKFNPTNRSYLRYLVMRVYVTTPLMFVLIVITSNIKLGNPNQWCANNTVRSVLHIIVVYAITAPFFMAKHELGTFIDATEQSLLERWDKYFYYLFFKSVLAVLVWGFAK